MKKKGLTAKSFSRIIFSLGFVVILITLGISIYFGNRLVRESEKLADNKFLAQSSNKKIELLAALSESYRGLAEDRDILETYLPREKKAYELISDLESMAEANNLAFDAFYVSKNRQRVAAKDKDADPQAEKVGDVLALPIEVTLKGSYTNLKKMVLEIENYQRLIEIKTVKYDRDMGEGTKGTDNIQALLKINAYYKK